jgi:Protein of unknown function (DUF3800)
LIDIDQLRDQQIRFHHLDNADNEYTFYHDETNNVRKLHIGPQGLNVAECKIFVLGGIVHEGKPHPIDIQPLRQVLQIQKTANEIKLDRVARDKFLDLLQSTKLRTFLRWIMESGLMIHDHDLDPLYWSFVDIIDSILANGGHPMLYQFHAGLKSDLALILRSDLAATIDIFHRYGCPSLAPESRKPFLEDLIDLVERNSAALPSFNFQMLKGFLQMGRRLDSLVFIEDNLPNRLIDNFSFFYLNRIAIFKYSSHVLDMEDTIRSKLLKTPITTGGIPATHYRFVDSKIETGIQLSDIIVGVLGKMHTYFTETPKDEVAAARGSLVGTSLENAELLRDLISTSDAANTAFLNSIGSAHDRDKLDLFLRFHDGAYAE